MSSGLLLRKKSKGSPSSTKFGTSVEGKRGEIRMGDEKLKEGVPDEVERSP